MNKIVLRHTLMAVSMIAVILMPVSHVFAATASLKPLSYVTARGSDSGNSVAAMQVQIHYSRSDTAPFPQLVRTLSDRHDGYER
jgi:hypothetical protein